MKAFKGCINKDCRAYKRTKYKASDKFCKECGKKLEFVCADCWKPLKNDKSRYCKECTDMLDSRKLRTGEAIKKTGLVAIGVGKKATEAIPVAAKTVRKIKPDAKELMDDSKKVVKAGAGVAKTSAKASSKMAKSSAKAGAKVAKSGVKAANKGRKLLVNSLAKGLRVGKKATSKIGKK